MKRLLTPCAMLWIASLLAVETVAQEPAEPDPALAQQAYQVLKKHCYRCHGAGSETIYFNALNHESMASYVVPESLDDSDLWQRVAVLEDMPPKKIKDRLTFTEVDVLKRWILSGAAAFPPEQPRVALSEADILKSIKAHLGNVPGNERRHQRYFSFTHLYNNLNVTDDELRLYRAAFSKLVNSLSRKPQIVLPEAVNEQQTVFTLDLRDLGWDDPQRWREVVTRYPYGIVWNENEDKVRELTKEVNEMLAQGVVISDDLPYLRGDWFVAKAARPPLYHVLLQLPESEQELAEELGVDFEGDFLRGKLMRAGFSQSGVSRHNRLIDRHVGTNTAYYYRSHDFGKSSGKGVLFRFPLGPSFAQNPFNDQAYEQDGGEIVFSLPNGLQGYLIVDKEGKRLDDAPVDIVRDVTEISGSPVVVNGVSCMGCHKQGVQRFEDNVRSSLVLGGEARDKVLQLYRPNDQLQSAQDDDTRRFLEAQDKAVRPFLIDQGDEQDQQKTVADFPEPVTAICNLYDSDIGLEEAARALGLKDRPGETPAQQLATTIRNNAELQQLGLGLLAQGYKIPREMWESREDFGGSVFQVTARAMNLGVPINSN